MPPHLPTPNLEKLKEAAALGDKWADGSWATTSDADLSVKALHSEQVRFRRRRQSEEAVLMRSWRWGGGGSVATQVVVMLDQILIGKPEVPCSFLADRKPITLL